uniref:Fibrous sheath-interacting protein 1 n=1 Tax=Latimeria chalumnae TaxID=7897 RepID=H3BGH7_LATCH
MDIVKGSLDEISRPASSSRSRPGSRVSSVSLSDRSRASSAAAGILVALTPEPGCPQIGSGLPLVVERCYLHLESHMVGCDNVSYPHQQVFGSFKFYVTVGSNYQACHRADTISFAPGKQVLFLLPFLEVPAATNVDEGTQQENTPVVSGHEHSDEENKDPKLTEAIKKMKKLDKILAKKQQNEREVKKRGQELRKHLWQELQAAIPEGVSERHEEAENTRRFLSLTAPPLDTAAGACDANEEVAFTSVFNTQIPPVDLASCEESKNFSSSKVDGDRGDLPVNNQGGMKGNKKTQDFIKKNIELAKEAGSQVLLTDDEKKRLAELLTDIEDTCCKELVLNNLPGW